MEGFISLLLFTEITAFRLCGRVGRGEGDELGWMVVLDGGYDGCDIQVFFLIDHVLIHTYTR